VEAHVAYRQPVMAVLYILSAFKKQDLEMAACTTMSVLLEGGSMGSDF